MDAVSRLDFLAEFNQAPFDRAEEMLRPCVDLPRWTSEISFARPFGTGPELVSFAELAAPDWTEAEIDAALVNHPRIGERASGAGREAELSRGEQAGIALSAGIREQLEDGNRRYEERFGRVFLIRAAGRSAEEVLAVLSERLGNTDEAELAATAAALREIAILRLEGLLNG